MTNKTTIYTGNAKTITTQYGDLMKISMTAEDVQKLQDNLNNGWINLVIKERRSPSAGGMTHYLEVDTWKPEAKASVPPTESGSHEPEITAEDLPF